MLHCGTNILKHVLKVQRTPVATTPGRFLTLASRGQAVLKRVPVLGTILGAGFGQISAAQDLGALSRHQKRECCGSSQWRYCAWRVFRRVCKPGCAWTWARLAHWDCQLLVSHKQALSPNRFPCQWGDEFKIFELDSYVYEQLHETLWVIAEKESKQ
jgi:hypothetical protein